MDAVCDKQVFFNPQDRLSEYILPWSALGLK